MKRPEWGAAGTFPQAWDAAEMMVRDGRPGRAVDLGVIVLRGLLGAHVVSIAPEQVMALPLPALEQDEPDAYGLTAQKFLGTRLPFDPLYISFGRQGIRLARFGDPAAPGVSTLGVLLASSAALGEPQLGPEPVVIPLVTMPGDPKYAGLAYFHGWTQPAITTEREGLGPGPSWKTWGISGDIPAEVKAAFGIDEKADNDGKTMDVDAAEIAAEVIYFMESVNVDLAPAPVSRQERRAVERKGGKIGLVVKVREPKRRRPTDPSGDHRDFSHRFERRGGYVHNFETKGDGSPNANFATYERTRPEKRIVVEGLPCYRFWRRDTVVGPVDKPLVVKVRDVECR